MSPQGSHRVDSHLCVNLDGLREIIQECPIIDNHAHNILLPEHMQSKQFLQITTEAHGKALEFTKSSLSHLRAVKQLSELYGCVKLPWDELIEIRREKLQKKPKEPMSRCFEGIHQILMDDGLDSNEVHRYDWHDQFTKTPTKRIVRIETLFNEVICSRPEHTQTRKQSDETATKAYFQSVLRSFEQHIADAIKDDEVVGFKSVICYRTGLDIDITTGSRTDSYPDSDLLTALSSHAKSCQTDPRHKLATKVLNDLVVLRTMQQLELSSSALKRGRCKPIQFHTGLGDNDIILVLSNPAYLQPLIEHFPTIPIVLLHAAYPFTREAGYLATVYPEVYLDVGEVFPMVSGDGQERLLRQAFELTPSEKVLWSTDGHWFPETYWLAVRQWRVALEKVSRPGTVPRIAPSTDVLTCRRLLSIMYGQRT